MKRGIRHVVWIPAVINASALQMLRVRLGEAGIRLVQTPFQEPNANAYAERFVRSLKHQCLNRVIPFGERHLRRTIAEYLEHYQRENEADVSVRLSLARAARLNGRNGGRPPKGSHP